MKPHFCDVRCSASTNRGFTILELMLVVVVIGLLVAVALPQYQSYVARSKAADLVLKFDAVRTQVQVAAKAGDAQPACAYLSNGVAAGNLQSPYAQLAVNFEPVAGGGFTPVLTMCAAAATQGAQGVGVTREAHHVLSRNSVISQGAVIGESAVSFSVKLAGDTALCQVLPPVGAAKAACGASGGSAGTTQVPTPTAAQVTAPASAQIPVPVASIPALPASATGGTSTPTGTQTGTQAGTQAGTQTGTQTAAQAAVAANTCNRLPAKPIGRQAMRFGATSSSVVTNNIAFNTASTLPAISAEVVITGDGASTPGGTLLSYISPRSSSGFSLWNPQSLHITLAGQEFNTGINVLDQQAHRITMSWRQSGGDLVLFDNGQEVWRRAYVNTGGTLGGNGRLVIGQDARPVSGGIVFRDGYSGSIVAATLATRAINAAQAAVGPLHTVLHPGSGLLTDVVMGPNGQPVDTTGRTPYVASGGVSAQSAMVSSAVYVDGKCQ